MPCPKQTYKDPKAKPRLYYGARYYNPKVSNWLSVDPIALYDPVGETEHYLDGEHNGGYFNPRNMSVYGYTYQNPIIYVDPNGKQSLVTETTETVTHNNKRSPGLLQIFEKENIGDTQSITVTTSEKKYTYMDSNGKIIDKSKATQVEIQTTTRNFTENINDITNNIDVFGEKTQNKFLDEKLSRIDNYSVLQTIGYYNVNRGKVTSIKMHNGEPDFFQSYWYAGQNDIPSVPIPKALKNELFNLAVDNTANWLEAVLSIGEVIGETLNQ